MRKITFLLFALIAFNMQSNAQIFIQENLDSGFPTGWSQVSYFASSTATYVCEGSGNIADNLYGSASNDGTFTSPNFVGASNETDAVVSFDWLARPYLTNAVDYIIFVEYSTNDGTDWNLVSSFAVTETTACTTYSEVIPSANIPLGSDFKFRIRGEWQSGDSYFYLDNILVSQTSADAPNCDSVLSETENVLTDGSISWSAATGIPAGYYISAGTASGVNDIADNVDNLNSTSYDLGALADGTTYYVTITPYNDNGSAQDCIEQSFFTVTAPVNNDCLEAIALNVNADLSCTEVISGTVFGASASGVDNCSGTANDDVWYSFVATSNAHVVSLTNVSGSATDLYHTVYDASPGCEALTTATALTCSDSNTSTTAGLIIGNTYFVQVYTYTSTAGQTTVFDVCVGTPPAPPANDDCSGAIAITLSEDGTCNEAMSGTTENALASSTGCTGGKDVWYTFTATEDANYIANVTETFESASFVSTYIAAFEGGCDGLTTVGSSASCFNSSALTIAATSGTTYYISIRSSSTTSYTEFDVCVYQAPAPPENDDFANALAIACGDVVTGNTTSASLDEDDAPDAAPDGNENGADTDSPNIWYSFMGTGDILELSTCVNTDFDTEILVFTGTSGALTLVDEGYDECGSNYEASTSFTTVVDTQYWISVEGYSSTSTGNFELSVTCTTPPPANDECTTSEALTLGVEITGDNTGATDSALATDCFTGVISDLWYSFVAPASGEVTVTTTAAQYAVYSDCAGAVVGECNVSVVGDLTEGTTYYVRVSDDGTARSQVTGSFTLLVSEAVLSTSDFTNQSLFSYYPNPVSDNLTLKAQKEISNVSVYNMIGQEVYRNAPNSVNNSVDMSNLQAGAYFVKVTIDNVTETIKVIKK
ncbi:T9SS type A sorting domain-containing protein [Olleya namhaensis]|uniref:Por secretion system C-terminal sorting domain-containing protein n=1 Tax=Olleya namhaensis TaxID=1144750 RepID=A0A1I3QLF2_9FLAO|nr:T9SS type A sorting domain-containing protein [Olleya namhaensis]SFJ34382.1 Por secretion system C-terminal sorting domain-containing protein [Olleya namhaensis]